MLSYKYLILIDNILNDIDGYDRRHFDDYMTLLVQNPKLLDLVSYKL